MADLADLESLRALIAALEESNTTLKESYAVLEESNTTLEENYAVLKENYAITEARALLVARDCSVSGLAKILATIKECQLSDVPTDVLDNYLRQPDASNTSREYVCSSASRVTAHQLGASTMQISKVRLHMMQGTQSRVNLKELELDEIELAKLVCESLFNSDDEEMNNFVQDQSAILRELRKAFYFRYKAGNKFTETAEFQPIFIDFLGPIVERCLGGVALSAQKNKLEGKLFIGDDENRVTEKEVNGHTDVLVLRCKELADDWTDSNVLKFHVELKSPFGALYQCSASAAKEQVVIETEIIAKMLLGDSSRRVLGALTDLFAIAIVVREAQRDEKSDDQPITYMSSRQLEPRAFLMRLLLLFCDLEDVAWRDLLSRSKTIVDTAAVEDDNPEAGEGDEGRNEAIANPSQDGAAADEDEAASGRAHLARNAKRSHFHTSKGQEQEEDEDEDEDEDEEGRAEAIKQLFQWEARRLGLAYLSESELNARNSAMPRFQHKEFPLL